MIHLLDTDACIHLLRGNSRVIEKVRSYSPEDLGISVVTGYELFYGIERCSPRRRASEGNKVQALLDALHVLPFTLSVGHCAARIRAELESGRTPIGPMDILIAAQAVDEGVTLMTGNVDEFSRVPGLEIVPLVS